MMTPTQTKRPTAAKTLPQFPRLPTEIRNKIFAMAAAEVSSFSLPGTRVNPIGLVACGELERKPGHLIARIDRVVSAHELLRPLLGLCRDSRSAVLGKEMFVLDRRLVRSTGPGSIIDSGSMPIFGGATEQVAVETLTRENDTLPPWPSPSTPDSI